MHNLAGTNPFRVIFTPWGSDFVALTAFYKNQQKTPKSDIDRAAERRGDWLSRMGDRPR